MTRYYWDRTKRHRLAVLGLAFILFLIAVAIVGPFFTQDPTRANFLEKNQPPVGFTVEQSVYDIETDKFVTAAHPGHLAAPTGHRR